MIGSTNLSISENKKVRKPRPKKAGESFKLTKKKALVGGVLIVGGIIGLIAYLKHLKKKVNVTTLVKLVGLRQPTVTFHINQLVKRGMLRKTKAGRNVYCQVHKKCDNCPLFA